MKNLTSLFLVIGLFVLSGVSAFAQPEIYGIGTELLINGLKTGEEIVELNLVEINDSILYKIDPATGIPTEIGPITGYTQCSGLDIHPITEEFFAVCDKQSEINPELLTRNGIFDTILLTLNRNTGQGTEIGSLQLSRGDFVSDISFRSDGTLFAHINGSVAAKAEEGADDITTNTVSANSLGIIDTQTGNLIVLGPTGSEDFWSAIGFTEADDLIQCTDNDNFFPGVANILNQNTGHASFIANLIYPPEFDGISTIFSKDFDLFSGLFFAILFSQGECCDEVLTTKNHTPDGSYLVTINPNNGDIDFIGQTSEFEDRFGAIAVLSQPTQVPTLSEYGLIVTVVMLLGVAVVFLRRRQVKSGI